MSYLFLALGGLIGIAASMTCIFLYHVRGYRRMMARYGEHPTLPQAIRYMAAPARKTCQHGTPAPCGLGCTAYTR